jgi:bifunctional non-homologous end joining protein LigD
MAEKQSEEVMVEVGGRTLRISNLAKVMYPTSGTTKGEVLNYYAQVAPVLLPHLADRAVTRIRWPHGTADMQFFEKNLPSGAPGWLRSVTVPSTGSRGGGDTIVFPLIEGLADLTYFANLASLELHVHQWTVGRNGRPKNPNRLVIDLDPGHGTCPRPR